MKKNYRNRIYLRVYSGLGNQQFQYAFAKAMSIKHSRELILDTSYFLPRYNPIRIQGRLYPYKLDRFDIDVKYTSQPMKEIIALLTRYVFVRKIYQIFQKLPMINRILPILIMQHNFDESCFKKKNTIIVADYFSKFASFEEYANTIRRDLSYKAKISKENRYFYDVIKGSKSVSLHIRRGDYVENTKIAKNFASVSVDYYYRAVDYILSNVSIDVVVLFSNDIDWVRKNLTLELDCLYIDNEGPDYEHQHLMSMCSHNVIANSTFSWWAAWLNKSCSKIVCAPKRWYASDARSNDIYVPNTWIRLDN